MPHQCPRSKLRGLIKSDRQLKPNTYSSASFPFESGTSDDIVCVTILMNPDDLGGLLPEQNSSATSRKGHTAQIKKQTRHKQWTRTN
jgi:hypothetical protein